jgi:DNA-binding XRE family transcriptional regulator
MNLQQQKEFIQLYNRYNSIDQEVIRNSLRQVIDSSGYSRRAAEVAEAIGVTTHTIYQIRKRSTNYKPEFITTLAICDFLGIGITDILTDHQSHNRAITA